MSSRSSVTPIADDKEKPTAKYVPPNLRSSSSSTKSAVASLLSEDADFPNGDEKVKELGKKFDIKTFKGRPSSCVFVASLSAALSDDQLCVSITKHFKQWGKLVMVKVLRDSANRPYAFVQYTSDEDANKALNEAQHSMLDGRTIRCEPAKVNRTLYISTCEGRLLSEKEVRLQLEQFGEIEDILGTTEIPLSVESTSFSTDHHTHLESYGKPQYIAWFCKFSYRDDAVRAYANFRSKRSWVVEWTQNIESKSNNDRNFIDRKAVFVGQLDSKISKELLFNRFSRHGEIVSLNVVSKPTNTFAFVRFKTEESTAAAVERENHSMLMNRTMHVQYRELNHSSQRNSRAPLLQLAPPPVNLPMKSSLNRKTNLEHSLTFDSKSGKGHNASAVDSTIISKENDPLGYMLASLLHKKLQFSKSIFSSDTPLETEIIEKSGTPSPTAGTAASSFADRKSNYSSTTAGDHQENVDKMSFVKNQMPYYYFYPPTDHSDLYSYGSNQNPSSYYYTAPQHSYYYENSEANEAPPQTPGYYMYYNGLKTPVTNTVPHPSSVATGNAEYEMNSAPGL